LKTVGYVEGETVSLEYHWAEGSYGELPRLAVESSSSS